MNPVYLDYNATTPLDPRVVDAMLPWLRVGTGNPSSSHHWGREARAAVDQARLHVADLLGCQVNELIFTSGGSEANNHALKGTAWARRDLGRHLVVSAVEHPAILEPAAWLEREGWRVSIVPVDAHGVVDPASVKAALTEETVLVSVMHANNETGVLQPLAAIAEVLADHQAWLHADCAQSVGKVPVKIQDLGIDMVSVAGHKLYGPKGVGALFVRDGLSLENLIHGAGHEQGRRAGTEAVGALAAFGEACRLAGMDLDDEMGRMRDLRDHLAAKLREVRPDAVVHGEAVERLPNTLSIGFPGLVAPDILARVEDQLGASAGAACHGSGGEVSGVLAAMGVPAQVALGTIRLTVGRFTTEDEVQRAIDLLTPVIGC